MTRLKISGLNFDSKWKNKLENFQNIETQITNLSIDILLLPEMFATGFCMKPEEIADQNQETLEWMKNVARKHNFAIAGTVATKENGRYYNRLYFVEPNGTVDFYDKRHLFSYAGEDQEYSAGTNRVIVEYKGWRILLQICYDLRFPVFSRNVLDYDVAVYVANWPKTRIDAWQTLLKARAIENQSYVFGINRIGTDGNQLEYPESSTCFFADGSDISVKDGYLISAELNFENLTTYRHKFPFLSDQDDFLLR